MAWGSVGTLGSANDKTAGTSIVMTTTAAAEAGNVVIVVVALNNNSTVDGDNSEVASISDSAGGNTWQKLREWTNGQGTAATGATVSVWGCVVKNAIASSGTITANFNHSPAASAITAWEFTLSVGNTITATDGTDASDDGADPSSMNLTPANEERLWVRGIAHEGPVADAFTKTAAYSTAFTKDGTTGGGGATNMSVCGEHDILTGTTNASDPTWTAVDHASVLVTLKESTIHAASVTIAAAASTVVSAVITAVGVLTMAAAGTISPTPSVGYSAVSSVNASGTVSAAAGLELPGAVSISASAALSPVPAADWAGGSTSSAVATVSAAGTVEIGGGVTHEGTASIAAAATLALSPAMDYSGVASTEGSAAVQAAALVDLGGIASITATGAIGPAGAAVDYRATAHLIVQGFVATTGTVTP